MENDTRYLIQRKNLVVYMRVTIVNIPVGYATMFDRKFYRSYGESSGAGAVVQTKQKRWSLKTNDQ